MVFCRMRVERPAGRPMDPLTKANIAIRDDWAEGAMDGWSRPIALKNPIADRLGVLPLIAFVAVDEARGASDGHDWRLNGD